MLYIIRLLVCIWLFQKEPQNPSIIFMYCVFSTCTWIYLQTCEEDLDVHIETKQVKQRKKYNAYVWWHLIVSLIAAPNIKYTF